MKTTNVKVRVKDIKSGVTVYTAHPVYGIRKSFIISKPYIEKGIGLFVKTRVESSIKFGDKDYYETTNSLCDMGVTPGNSYNGRRTFFKLKHAQAWMDKWSTDKGFQATFARHEEWCQSTAYLYDDY